MPGDATAPHPPASFLSGDVASLVREMLAARGEGPEDEKRKTDVIMRMRALMMPASEEGGEDAGAITAEEEALYHDMRAMVTSLTQSEIYTKISSSFDEMRTVVTDAVRGADGAGGGEEDYRARLLNVASYLRDDIAGARAAAPGAGDAAPPAPSPIEKLLATAAGVMRSVLAMTCRQVPSIEMPVLSGLVDSPIGKVVYHLGNLKFSSFGLDIDGINATVPPASSPAAAAGGVEEGGAPRRASVEVRGINCRIEDLQFSYGKVYTPHCMGEGACSVEVAGCDLSLQYDVEMTSRGVVLTVLGSEVSVARLEVTMSAQKSSAASWLYGVLLSVLNKRLTRIIQQNLSNVIAVQVRHPRRARPSPPCATIGR